jgi:serine/threonine-protein kinase
MTKPISLFFSLTLLTAAVTGCSCGPEPSLGDTRIRPTDGMVMVYVPGGEFTMGSTDEEMDYALALCSEYCDETCINLYGGCERDWFDDEQPTHDVALDGFWFDRTEVTNEQFAAFLNEKGNQEEEGRTWLDLAWNPIRHEGCEYQTMSGHAKDPVIDVSWHGAVAYCEWAGGRLPTEAEWEYAARGPEGHIFPWGDELDKARLNYCDVSCRSAFGADESFDDGYGAFSPVGAYPAGASWCGALDLAGNAWEWTADWYGEYPSGRQENPAGPISGEYRSVRGGCWAEYLYNVRTASRSGDRPNGRYGFIGFRCAASSAK